MKIKEALLLFNDEITNDEQQVIVRALHCHSFYISVVSAVYITVCQAVLALKMVNDCTERDVRLATDFNEVLTKSADQRQPGQAYQVVKYHRLFLPTRAANNELSAECFCSTDDRPCIIMCMLCLCHCCCSFSIHWHICRTFYDSN